MKNIRQTSIYQRDDGYCITFDAMASPCEIIIETKNITLAEKIAVLISNEVWRIEDKYSRYDKDSVCSHININAGKLTKIDNETFLLLNFADTCYQLSDGLFDITSGALRKVWQFDCSDNIPSQELINQILPKVGWSKISFNKNSINLPQGMEIDFGGIGKEYAVDRSILLAKKQTDKPILINLGGDLASTSSRRNNKPWQVGVEHPGFESGKTMVVSLYKGALATSGDAKRYLLKDNVRYSHILNARTGWPITQAPRSMTVTAPQCIQAGILATLSLMQGKNAERYLEEQEVKFWAIR